MIAAHNQGPGGSDAAYAVRLDKEEEDVLRAALEVSNKASTKGSAQKPGEGAVELAGVTAVAAGEGAVDQLADL